MRFWAVASLLAASLSLGVAPACSTDFNQPLTCSVLALQLELPATMAPDSSTRLRLSFDTPIGARYQIDWLASRGTIKPKGTSGGGGASGAAGTAGEAGISGAGGSAGQAGTGGISGAGGAGGAGSGGAAGTAGTAGGVSGTSGQGGDGGDAGEAGEAGAAGGEDIPASTYEVDFTAPDSVGEVLVTATLTRLEGEDGDGPASCSINGKIQVLTEDQLAAGAGGVSGASGAGGGP